MNTFNSVKNKLEHPTVPLVARVTYDTAWHLGSATRTARDGFWNVGKLIREAPGALLRCPQTIGRRIRGASPGRAEERSLPAREDIRSIVIEEMARLQVATKGLTLLDLEKRLRRMADTIESLQKRINELGTRGPVSEADVWKEMNSLESADSLTNDERTLLVGVFRRNMALQKPEVAGVSEGKR